MENFLMLKMKIKSLKKISEINIIMMLIKGYILNVMKDVKVAPKNIMIQI